MELDGWFFILHIVLEICTTLFMYKFNMSFVFHFYILGLTPWIWTSSSTEELNFESPSKWNSYEGFNLEHWGEPSATLNVVLSVTYYLEYTMLIFLITKSPSPLNHTCQNKAYFTTSKVPQSLWVQLKALTLEGKNSREYSHRSHFITNGIL